METMASNPFVGPRSFDENDSDRFFGRRSEILDLTSLLYAHRILLLYSQSGSGKSSLINAGILPEIKRREDFNYVKTIRIGNSEPDYADKKFLIRFMASSMGLMNVTDIDDFSSWSSVIKQTETPRFTVIVLDQFEEIFTKFNYLWEARSEFLEFLGSLVSTFELLRVVLVMREEYVPQIDKFAGLFKNKLVNRFYLEKLKKRQAMEAIMEPFEKAGYTIKPSIVEKLNDELSKVRFLDPLTEEERTLQGEYIDPLQLQLVCFNLAEKCRASRHVTEEEIIRHGNVTDILIKFYDSILTDVAINLHYPERHLRQWIENKLITPYQTKSSVLFEKESTGGLPNNIIDYLESMHLVQKVHRANASWIELSHDRLIEPIIASNRNAASLDISNITSWYYKLLDAIKEGEKENYDVAFKLYAELLNEYEDFHIIYYHRATNYWYLGDYNNALIDFNKFYEKIHLYPEWIGLLYNARGQTLAEFGIFGEARKDLLKSIELASRNYDRTLEAYSRNGLGLALGGLGLFEESFMEFKKSINVAPNNAWVYFNRAQVYLQMEEYMTALNDLKISLKKDTPKLSNRKLSQANAQIKELTDRLNAL